MTRNEIKDTAINNFGFEHEVTLAIFAIDEYCPDDKVALVAMETALIKGFNALIMGKA